MNELAKRHKVVFFYDKNCKVFSVNNLEPFINLPNCVINPDVKHLERVPMQYWKIHLGEIIEMSPVEKKLVDSWHLRNRQTNPNLLIIPEKVIEKEVTAKEVKVNFVPWYQYAILVISAILNLILLWRAR